MRQYFEFFSFKNFLILLKKKFKFNVKRILLMYFQLIIYFFK
jgi:hypothetical protein